MTTPRLILIAFASFVATALAMLGQSALAGAPPFA